MRNFILVLIFVCLSVQSVAEANSRMLVTKSHGTIEFSDVAFALYKKYSRLRRATDYLLRNRRCERSAKDLESNEAVHYTYACVVEVKKQSVIIYSSDKRTQMGVNFRIALLTDQTLQQLKQRTEYQLLSKHRPPPVGGGPRDFPRAPVIHFWYRLTLLDIQDPENLELASVRLAQFDKALSEIEAGEIGLK